MASAAATIPDEPQPLTGVKLLVAAFALALANFVVVLDSSDERGQEANDELHDVRAEIWRALVGWEPGSEYDPITYDGGSLVHISRARVVYRFSFVAEFQLGRSRRTDPAETWQELELDGLPAFRGADVDIDPIDPKDSSHSAPGPDGRVDVRFSIDPSQECPT